MIFVKMRKLFSLKVNVSENEKRHFWAKRVHPQILGIHPNPP